jgi:hypothetical protein
VLPLAALIASEALNTVCATKVHRHGVEQVGATT